MPPSPKINVPAKFSEEVVKLCLLILETFFSKGAICYFAASTSNGLAELEMFAKLYYFNIVARRTIVTY